MITCYRQDVARVRVQNGFCKSLQQSRERKGRRLPDRCPLQLHTLPSMYQAVWELRPALEKDNVQTPERQVLLLC